MPKGEKRSSPPFPVHSFVLDNGMGCILIPDAASPTVSLDLSYGVGSKNDPGDRTGLAHYYEHMMFEGSANHSNNFIQQIEQQGGRVNGGTSRDRTQYWSIVPPAVLPELLRMEADRMAHPNLDPASFAEQKGIITNERLEKYDNAPFGLAVEHFHRMLYPKGHPYHAPVIGSLEHIQQTTLKDLTAFTKQHYHPGNAHLAIAGPIDTAQIEALIRECFSFAAPPHNSININDISGSTGAIAEMTDDVAYPKGYLAWHSPKAFAEDDAAFDILAYLLTHSGRGRLQQSLNDKIRLVEDLRVVQVSRQHGGLFRIDSVLTPQGAAGNLAAEVPGAIKQVLASVDEYDLAQAKGQLQLQELLPRARSGGFGGLVDALNFFGCLTGDHNQLFTAAERYQYVTLDDVRRCAETLTADRATSLAVTKGPKPKSMGAAAVDSLARKSQTIDHPPLELPEYQPEPTEMISNSGSPQLLRVAKSRQPLQSSRLCFDLSGIAGLQEKPFLARYLEQVVGHRFAANLAPFGQIAAAGGDFEIRVQAHIADLALLAPADQSPQLASAVKVIAEQASLSEKSFAQLTEDFSGRIGRMRGNKEFLLEQTAKHILLGKSHEACRLRFPTPTDLATVSRGEIVDLWHTILKQPNLAISAGPDAVATVEQYFAGLGISGSPWSNAGNRQPIDEPPVPLSMITLPGESGSQIDLSLVLKTPGLDASNEAQAALVLLEDGLGGGFGSRMDQALRRLGPVSYGVRSNYIPYQDCGLLILSCSVAAEQAREATEILLNEIDQLASGQSAFTPEEVLQAARHYLVRSFPSFETAQNHSAKLRQLISLGLPTDHFDQLWAVVRTLGTNPDSFNQMVPGLLNNGMAITIKGDADKVLPLARPHRLVATKMGDDLAPQMDDL